jgi:hypothetical protein
MSARTIFLAKLIGLGLLGVAVAMVVNKPSMLGTINLVFHEPAFILTYGMIALFAGLAMVIGHNVWSGGALPIAVTFIGWLALLRGLLLLMLSPAAVLHMLAFARFAQFYGLYVALIVVIGGYLTYAGFRATTTAA